MPEEDPCAPFIAILEGAKIEQVCAEEVDETMIIGLVLDNGWLVKIPMCRYWDFARLNPDDDDDAQPDRGI